VLKVIVYDRLAGARDYGNPEQQAARHGVSRAQWYGIRAGSRSPSATLALRVAEQLEVQPQVIWGREAVTADA
jgi:hypothetical protein